MAKSATPIPWFRPELAGRETSLLLQVLESGYFNEGDVTLEFERRIAELVGVKHCVAVTSGTAAIAVALMGLGVGLGDEVIVPDLTFIATANAARLAGADVRLVDVEHPRFTLDPEAVVQAVGPRTRAIVTVDINGRAANYDLIEAFCRERGLALVCDVAEGLGSRYKGRALGGFGDAGCFSFSPNKTVTTGQGGMIATNDDGLYYRLLELKDQGRRTRGTGGNDLHPVLGFNFKFANVLAAIGLAQLERLSERLEKGRRREAWYRECLADCDGVEFPPNDTGEVPQWTDVLIERRGAVERALDEAGIGYRAFWFPVHSQAPYKAAGGPFPNTIRISQRGLWLPSYFGLTLGEVERISEVIRHAV